MRNRSRTRLLTTEHRMEVEALPAHGHEAHHLVHFYDSDDLLVGSVSRYLARGLDHGATAIVFATAEHLEAFGAELLSLGLPPDPAHLVAFDAEVALAEIFIEGRIDPVRFDEVIGAKVVAASSRGKVRAYGELVELLWRRGAVAAAVQLEELWDRLGQECGFQLLCAYTMPSLADDGERDAFNAVCQLHSGVVAHPADVELDTSQHAVRAFPAAVHAPSAARRFVAETAASWGLEITGEAAVIVSELATNAVVHATSPFTVTISSSDGTVRLAVRDESAELPEKDPRGLLAESGRGLGLVQSLSARWGVRRFEGAKEIWAEVGS